MAKEIWNPNNEIESEYSGEIIEILIEDGQPVEYGQPLFTVKET